MNEESHPEGPDGQGGRHTGGGAGRRPPRVLLGAVVLVLLWLVVGGTGGQLAGKLSDVQTNDNASFLPKSAESTEVVNKLAAFSDTQTFPFLVVVEKQSGTLTPGDLAGISAYAASIPGLRLPALGASATVGDYLTGKAAPTVVPSRDGEAALITVPLNASTGTAAVAGTTPLYQTATALRDAATTLGPGLTAYVGGPGGLIADFVDAFSGIDGILLGVALLVVFVILLIVYRSPILPFAVLFSAVFGLALASLAVYPLAKAGHIALSGQSQGIMFILVVGAATDYSLLLVSRFREELHDRSGSWPALKRAWRGTVEPIVASASTVILGLLCLLFATLQSTSGLGPVGAFAILGALLAALTFLPAMLVLGGRYVFWPFVPRVDHVHSADKVGTRSVWGRVATMVGTHPRRTWGTTLVLLVAAAAFAPSFKATGIPNTDIFLTKVGSVQAQKVLDRHFPGGAGSPVEVVAPQDKAAAVLAVMKSEKGLENAFIGLTPAAAGSPPVVRNGDVVLQATLTAPPDSQAAVAVVKKLRTDLDAVSTKALVGGSTAVNLDVQAASDRDLKVIVPIILAVIFVVLGLLLRSLVAPVLLVIANVLSFGATIGISALMFNHVFGFPGADPAIPLYGFVFLVALGIDYSIFLMTRVREESRRPGNPGRHPRGARRDRGGHHERRRRPRIDLLRARRPPTRLPRRDRVHRRLRRAARHPRRPLPPRAVRGLRHRPLDLVARAAVPGGRRVTTAGPTATAPRPRAGIVGYAAAGRGIHAPLLTEAGFDVAAVVTRDPGRRASALADLPEVTVVDDLEALLGVPGLDLVVLATPTGAHAPRRMPSSTRASPSSSTSPWRWRRRRAGRWSSTPARGASRSPCSRTVGTTVR